jgi:hypothetical protein
MGVWDRCVTGWILVFLFTVAAVFGVSAQVADLGPAIELQLDSALSVEGPVALGPSTGLTVDTSDRTAVVNFWNDVYQDSQGVSADWTGDMSSCTAGTTSAVYHEATLRRINYYRAMAGLPGDVVFSAVLDSQCQDAALMMIAEGSLSHSPPATWTCYTATGAAAAGKSNLALGNHGPSAIDAYIRDSGSNNTAAGHRRWILYPRQTTMGSGSTTGQNGFYFGSNALWVLDQASWGPRPAGVTFVAWPPAGYVPYQVVYSRWSFSMPGADFTGASVTMTQGENPIALSVVHGITSQGGYGDPTIVWEPQDLPWGAPAQDTTYSITISGVTGTDSSTYSYDVTVIDPSAVIEGPATTDIVSYLLGLGPDLGNFNVNNDTEIDAADVVTNILAGR